MHLHSACIITLTLNLTLLEVCDLEIYVCTIHMDIELIFIINIIFHNNTQVI